MAEIEVGDRPQADHDNMFKDSVTQKVIRRVKDDAAIAILQAIADEIGAASITTDPHFASTSNNTTPGVEQELLSEIVPANIDRELSRVVVVCRQEGHGRITVDGSLVGSYKTGAASPSGTFEWLPRYHVLVGGEIKVFFRARAGAPISTVDCHLQAIDNNT